MKVWRCWGTAPPIAKGKCLLGLKPYGEKLLHNGVGAMAKVLEALSTHVLDWHVVPNTLPTKIGKILSRYEVLMLKEVGFWCNKGRFSLLATCFPWLQHSQHWTYLHPQVNPDVHPPFKFKKLVHRNLVAPMIYHKDKWKNLRLMDGYYVVGVTNIPYLGLWV